MQAYKTLDVKHINGDTLDCRRANLRLVTRADSLHGRKMYRNNTSGFTGVSYYKSDGTWLARLGEKRLGAYKTPEEANAARLEAEAREWGIHPRRQEAHDAI
jgi:beta-glucosidase/6-phospho-beta-glucosidase/beta-galactosidase